MKTIAEQLSLHGQNEEITATQFRAMPGEVLKQVELGKRFIITRNGKQMAVLQKPQWNTDAVVSPDGK